MKATVFFRSTVAVFFLSSMLFLAGCTGLSSVSSPATPAPPAPPAGGGSSAHRTSAFVYVLSHLGGNNFEIDAFSADSNGQLTPVPGSPFAANVHAITANR